MSTVFDQIEPAAVRERFPHAFQAPLGKRVLIVAGLIAVVGLFIFGCIHLGFSFDRLALGIKQIFWFLLLMVPPSTGGNFASFLSGMAQTLSIAFLGTMLATVLAFPFGFLAARNVIPPVLIRFPLRRFFDVVRGVDTLVWALIWINVVGLGPFAGVLAIAASDFGALGKLFSEAVEGADRRSVDGIRSTGGDAIDEVRFGLLPQVLPVIASQVLYFFESNTRSATIIGIVGAGGIGLQLSELIRTNEWPQVSFVVLLILVAVAVIDVVSTHLRFAMMGRSRRG